MMLPVPFTDIAKEEGDRIEGRTNRIMCISAPEKDKFRLNRAHGKMNILLWVVHKKFIHDTDKRPRTASVYLLFQRLTQ